MGGTAKILVSLQGLPAHPSLPESDELGGLQGYRAFIRVGKLPLPTEAECFLYHLETHLGKSGDLAPDPRGETSARSSWGLANMRLERERGSAESGNLQFLRPRLVAIDGLSAKSEAPPLQWWEMRQS